MRQICTILLFIFISITSYAFAQDGLKGFKPMLLKVEVNTDKLSPKDEFVITATWQNIGTEPANQALKCFLEMEFGYQRTLENTNKEYKYYWEPYPAMTQWKPGEIKSISYRMNFPSLWGGTYKLFLGICDYENVHFDFIGNQGLIQKRVEIGHVDLGWGWGIAILELTRKPWSKEFNQARNYETKESPIEKIHLVNNNLKAIFNAEKPALIEVKFGKETQSIKQLEPEIVFRDYLRDKVLYSYNKNVKVSYKSEKMGADLLVYHGSVKYEGYEVAKFDIQAQLSGRDILITLGKTWEAKDFELIEIKLFSLYSNANETTNIVSFLGGGKLIPLKTANPFGYMSPYDTRNAIGVYDQSGIVVLESTCLDDKVYTIVDETNGVKSAVIGASIATRVCGKKHVRSIEVPNVHSIRISFLGNEWGEPSWMSVAKFLRKDLQGKGREKYKNSVFSLYYCNGGPEPEPWQVKEDSPYAITRLNQGIKFKEILPVMINYSRLLDGYKQITKLYGWFKDQEDDRSLIGFPSAAVLGVDHRVGTMEELLNVFSNSEKHNVKTQFYDHYDNIYLTPRNDSSMVAMDAEGNPWKGWIWAEGQSHILGQRKYWETGAAQKRIKYMIDQFKLKDMTHFDVLSSEVLRWDFDPKYPSSAHTSYLNKLNIVKEYNKYGIDVSSESLTHPFVGHISYAYHTRMNLADRYFSGESFIYLIPAIYHGIIQFNLFSGGASVLRQEILNTFIASGHYGFELDRETYEQLGWIYIQNMPMNKLYDEKWENFSEKDGITVIKYTNNCSVMVDKVSKRYEITYKGRVIAKDWTTFIEGVKPGSYLAFSLDGGEMIYDAPEGWTEKSALKAITLTKDGEGAPVPCMIKDGKIRLDLLAGVPVRVIKN